MEQRAGAVLINLLHSDKSAVRVTYRGGWGVTKPARGAEGGARPYPFAALVTSAYVPVAEESEPAGTRRRKAED
jgi:hypothetical protein